ncbi:probable low-specificity L-threonine aldolase 2 [Eurytemora carolleeae]|uniref:probable low-specificity L-threonine aldolase 2 n=1 Tax=Eurytemora carolleeae TaxID=1294199 RepID=UPI000C769F02|nr:probable low-specificity L-threonine aldolase 2 [Eurytemora carolleeae]|eukprot:XP_023321463.1 probable low-specificity L-threonine aldolase 2 [Eurytemora affinis]
MNPCDIVQTWVGEKSLGRTIDLRSDTVTKPGEKMRTAIFNAPVGDDVFRDDPTVLLLESKIAEMSCKEAGLFVPSGTMGNLISVLTHCSQRGAEILLGDKSHIHLYEQGGVAQLGGVHPRTVKNLQNGTFSLEELESKIRSDDPHHPITSLVAIENSHNKCGGTALPLNWISDLSSVCRKNNLPLHCDGARIFNSCISQGEELSTLLQGVDTASICLSKGLGSPVGSLLVGNKEFIRKAIRARKALGGGMRQAGILAAAGLYSLENMVDRLKEDHDHAKQLAEAINQAGNSRFHVDLKTVETNIVIMWVDPLVATADQVVQRLEEGDIKVRTIDFGVDQVRFVFHCMIQEEDAELVILKVIQVIQQYLE